MNLKQRATKLAAIVGAAINLALTPVPPTQSVDRQMQNLRGHAAIERRKQEERLTEATERAQHLHEPIPVENRPAPERPPISQLDKDIAARAPKTKRRESRQRDGR
jgi:hypothetical protein